MKKIFLLILTVIFIKGNAMAGFLGGDLTPNVSGAGQQAFKMGTSILMVGTPFSSLNLSYKYCLRNDIGVYSNLGVGTIDYATYSEIKVYTNPQLYGIGVEYNMSASPDADSRKAFVMEYEAVNWSVNKTINDSSNIMFAYDMYFISSEDTISKYRIGYNNFNAGAESGEKITTSGKYLFSTSVEYSVSNNLKTGYNGGLYFGGKEGLVAFIGLHIGFII